MKRTILIVLAVSSLAYAGDKEKADSLFKQGKKLMGEKKYEQACDSFEQSQKLDPGIGTELNIARCYEEWGKTAHASAAYKSALKMAKDANDSRADKIDGLINQLEPSVPHLTMHIPKDADASSVRIDGAPIDDITAPIPLDPGPHKVEYTTSTGGKKSKTLPIEKGGSYDANLIDLPTKGGEQVVKQPPPPPPPPHVEPTSDPGKNYRIAAYAVGGAGVVAIGVSSYLTLSAKSSYNDALKKDCAGMTNMCNDAGLTATHDARHKANIATIVFSVGLAAVGGGVALYLLRPHESKATETEKEEEALYLVPSVTPDSAGLVFGGGF
jgi:tetratricopeptide (TPR) repeat protein